MKILHITARADFGGGPEHVCLLVKELINKGEHCFVACPNEAPYFTKYAALIGSDGIITIPHRKFSFKVLFEIARFAKKNEIQVIHSHGKGAGVYGRLLKLFTRINVVHTYHGFHVGSYGKMARKFYCFYESLMSLLSNAVICVSHKELEDINKEVILPRNKNVIVNGVKLPLIHRANNLGSIFTIVVVSRFDYQKNTEELIDALFLLDKKGIKPSVFILGDGDAKAALIKRAEVLKNVKFVGNTPTPREFYKKAHLFINTSRWEGLPIAPLEAMSEGLPCILSEVTGNIDLVSKDYSNIYYPSGNFCALAEEIDTAMQSSTKLYKQGLLARNMIQEHFSVEHMAAQTKRLYKDLS